MTNEVKNVPELRFSNFSEEWEDNLVGSLFEFKNGLNKGKEYFGYGLPIVNFKDVFHNRGIKGEYLHGKVDVSEKELQNYSVRKGDVFFTRTSEIIEEIGYPTVMMDEIPKAVFSGFVLRARPKKNIKLVDDKFKRYVFFTYSFRKEMITKSSITTRALTSGTAINKMKVVYPTSIEEQNKIGDFFSKLDRQIELEEQKLSLLEEQKKGYMQQIFSQKLRFKDENGKDYPLWEIKKLGELYKVVMGQSPKSINYTDDNSHPVLVQGNADIYNGNIFPRMYTKEITKLVKKGDILLTVRAPVGEIGIAQFEACMGRGVCSIEGNKFIYYFLEMFGIQNKWQKLSQGSTFESISGNEVRNIEIPIPSPSEREKISDFFSELDHLINMHSQKVDELKLRKQGFLQKMFV